MRRQFVAFVWFVCSCTIHGERCLNLSGIWYGEHGSNLIVNHTEDGMFFGECVLSLPNGVDPVPNSKPIRIIGSSPYNVKNAVFGLSMAYGALWTISVTGQCLTDDDDEELLETSWLMRHQVDGCGNRWQPTGIGRSVFKRHPQSRDVKRRDLRHLQTMFDAMFQDSSNNSSRSRRDVNDIGDIRRCMLKGYWYNEIGSEMFISTHHNDTIIGEYRTAEERQGRAISGSSHSIIYGLGNADIPHSALAFFVVWNNGESITGWVGQCYLCGRNQSEILQTYWLHRTKVNSTSDNWRSTMYGENLFTRQQQSPRGPHGNTVKPGQVGEVWSPKPTVTSRASSAVVLVLRWRFTLCCCSCQLLGLLAQLMSAIW